MLRFSILGFPVTIHWMFWVVVFFLGWNDSLEGPAIFVEMLPWMAAAFISILIHELGHTFLQRAFGAQAQIFLYAMGGLAIPDRGFTRGQDILISLAGPVVQIIFGTLAALPLAFMPPDSAPAWTVSFLHDFVTISIFWGVINLLPIFPLDGGHILKGILGPKLEKVVYVIGGLLAVGIGVWMVFGFGSVWNAMICGLLAWENFRRMQGPGQGQDPSLPRPPYLLLASCEAFTRFCPCLP